MSVPKLRFPKFSDNWQQSRLGEVFDWIRTNSLSRANLSVDEGIVQNIHYGDIHSKFQALFDQSRERIPYIKDTEVTAALKDEEFCRAGDLVIADASEDYADIGKAIEIVNVNPKSLVAGLHTYIARPKNGKTALGFSGWQFVSPNMRKQIMRIAQGISVLGISKTNLSEITTYFPSLPEQKKIADFLGAVDEKLHLLLVRHEQLTLYKKGVMQKIFTQTIRFKADDGSNFPDWESKPLGDVLYETRKRNYDLEYDKSQVLSVSGEKGIVNQIGHLGRSYAGASVDNYHVVEVGDVVYTKSPLKLNPYGIIKVNKKKAGIVSTLYAVYRPFDPRSGDYIDHYFSIDDNLNKYLRPLVRKGAKNDMKINNAYVLSDPISIPCLAEQQKIADFLSTLDDKISAVSAQVDQMQAFKKGLLQQMFV
ncbi:restriction endonuclease subunit S [Litorimonas sp.]|uniref:restriction endonuclease subunit S n=1 Tax=Litorimonas sp. TaxID=1892381 RepID=UPI003A88FABE